MGDFSTLVHLPDMYSHCKETEDPDLNLADFVGEHLMNLDMIFEAHPSEEEDDDKPHQAVPFVFQNQVTPLTEKITTFEFKNTSPFVSCFEIETIGFKNQIYLYNPNFSIFSPPIEFS